VDFSSPFPFCAVFRAVFDEAEEEEKEKEVTNVKLETRPWDNLPTWPSSV